MRKYILIIILIIIYSCDSKPSYEDIIVNKSIKVYSMEYHDKAENYTFKWKPPIGPNNKEIKFSLKNDMLIFTPILLGKYQIYLSIEDISEKIVSEEIFYYRAIPDTTNLAIFDANEEIPSTDKNINKVSSKNETSKNLSNTKITETKKKSTPLKRKKTPPPSSKRKKKTTLQVNHKYKYAIQISAWPSLIEARKHQLFLIDKGFDAYTQKYFIKDKDEVWYRVRVGEFTHKKKAIIIKKQIESITGFSTWLDAHLIK